MPHATLWRPQPAPSLTLPPRQFCCSVASWYCWGSTHFCDACHRRQVAGDYLTRKPRTRLPRCPGKNQCPLGVEHPPNGDEFCLGCAICRRKNTTF